MARLPILGTGDKVDQKHLPAHLDPTTMTAVSTADRARANHTGTQTSATISDLTEVIQDGVAALLVQGTGVTLAYNDTANTLTITSTGGSGGVSDPEAIRDTIATALIGVGLISVTINDAADTITISTTATANSTNAVLLDRANHTGTQLSTTVSDFAEKAQDTISTTVSGGAGIGTFYDDVNNVFSIFAEASPSGSIAITDNFDGTAVLSVSDVVTPVDQPPLAAVFLTPSSGATPLVVSANASGSSDPQGQALTYAFTWGDGTTVFTYQALDTLSHTYSVAGTYTVTVSVKNVSGLTDTAVATVSAGTVTAPPVARIVATPTSGLAPLSVSANASTSTDPGGLSLTYSFNWGDGTAATAYSSTATASHTYLTSGTWRPAVTVKNSANSTNTATTTVTVTVTSPTVKMEMGFSGTPGNVTRGIQATGAPVGTIGVAYTGSGLIYPKGTRGPFYTATNVPSTWTTTQPRMAPDGAGGFARVYVSFSAMPTSNLSSYAASAPAGTRFIFVHEVENQGKGYSTGASYLTAYRTFRNTVKAAKSSVEVGMASASYAYRTGGLADVLAGNYLPAPSECDFYGVDCYQGDQNNPYVFPASQPVQPLSVHTKYQNWYKAMLAKNPKGSTQKPWGLTEYGINFEANFGDVQTNGLDKERSDVMVQDAAYLTSQGCRIWLYWYYTHDSNGAYPLTREFADQPSLNNWRKIVADNN